MSSTCRMNRLSPPKREGLSLSCVTPNSQPGALLLQHWLSIKVQKLDSIPIRGIDPTGLIYPIPLTHPLRDLRWICKHRDELGKGHPASCRNLPLPYVSFWENPWPYIFQKAQVNQESPSYVRTTTNTKSPPVTMAGDFDKGADDLRSS